MREEPGEGAFYKKRPPPAPRPQQFRLVGRLRKRSPFRWKEKMLRNGLVYLFIPLRAGSLLTDSGGGSREVVYRLCMQGIHEWMEV